MEAIVFIILQIVFATCTVLKIGEYSQIFPSFSWRLDQSHTSKNIWWIITKDIQEEGWKYDVQQSIFDEIWVVWIADETVFLKCLIYLLNQNKN